MPVRTRQTMENVPGVRMMVRTMSGVGALYEHFEPQSLDHQGAMLVLRGRVDSDTPIRVIVAVTPEIAQRYAQRFEADLNKIKKTSDGLYQLFGNWLKVKWTQVLEDSKLEQMACNKLLWDIHDHLSDDVAEIMIQSAHQMKALDYTTNVEITLLLDQIVQGNTLEYPMTREGLHQLARSQAPLTIKLLYVLLGGHSYSEVLHTVADFKARYLRDPFQRRYGVLHGTMALNQGQENWERTFRILRELVEEA